MEVQKRYYDLYGQWPGFGWGGMLVLYHDKECIWIKFTSEDTGEEVVIDANLYLEYRRE